MVSIWAYTIYYLACLISCQIMGTWHYQYVSNICQEPLKYLSMSLVQFVDKFNLPLHIFKYFLAHYNTKETDYNTKVGLARNLQLVMQKSIMALVNFWLISILKFFILSFHVGLDAPENTLKAAKQAKANGAKCVTFDVAFTFDGVAVVSSRPDVSSKTFANVRQIDVADGHILVRMCVDITQTSYRESS